MRQRIRYHSFLNQSQRVLCRYLRKVDMRMQKQACGIVGGFMEDIFGKELKPWQESEKPETEQ